MKLNFLLYISRALPKYSGSTLTLTLSQICGESRKNNSKLDITGLISYSNGYFMQAIEGEREQVHALYRKIAFDNRHSHIVKILDVEIDQRFFPNWDMKLISSPCSVQHFYEVKRILKFNLSLITEQKKRLLEDFGLRLVTQGAGLYENKAIRLSGWPDFSKISDLPYGIELTAALAGTKLDYNTIVESGEFGEKNQINEILNILEDISLSEGSGLLVIEDSDKSNSGDIKKINPVNTFYNKMKRLIKKKAS